MQKSDPMLIPGDIVALKCCERLASINMKNTAVTAAKIDQSFFDVLCGVEFLNMEGTSCELEAFVITRYKESGSDLSIERKHLKGSINVFKYVSAGLTSVKLRDEVRRKLGDGERYDMEGTIEAFEGCRNLRAVHLYDCRGITGACQE